MLFAISINDEAALERCDMHLDGAVLKIPEIKAERKDEI